MKEVTMGHGWRDFNLRRIIEVLSMFSTDMDHLVNSETLGLSHILSIAVNIPFLDLNAQAKKC